MAGFVLGALLPAIRKYNDKASQVNSTEITDELAAAYWNMAQTAVNDCLYYPDTAVYPDLSDDNVEINRKGKLVSVSGYVTAQLSDGSTGSAQFELELIVYDIDTPSFDWPYINLGGSEDGTYISFDEWDDNNVK